MIINLLNQIHIIIVINITKCIDSYVTHVETHGRASLQSTATNESESLKLIRLPESISSFVAGFKSAVNSAIDDYIDDYQLGIPKYNRNNHFFQDRIIRNKTEYERIKNYIINNPHNWKNDEL